MPIHLRAEPGDYAAACCARRSAAGAYIAETFFDPGARLVNEERGMLGFTGTFEGTPISVQSTGMGCPQRGHRVRGADHARRHAADPGRHVRRVRTTACAWATRSIAVSAIVRRRDAAALRRHGEATRRRPRSRSSRRRRAWPRGRGDGARRPDRDERHLLRPRPDERRRAGSGSATSASRWRRRCCTRSPRSSGVEALAMMTVSDLIGDEATASGSATTS